MQTTGESLDLDRAVERRRPSMMGVTATPIRPRVARRSRRAVGEPTLGRAPMLKLEDLSPPEIETRALCSLPRERKGGHAAQI